MTFSQRYPLHGTALDVPLEKVLAATPQQRTEYISDLFAAFADESEAGTMSCKAKVKLGRIVRDFSLLNSIAPDKYLFTDEATLKRNVLGKGGPGGTHVHFSRLHMWKMETKMGNLADAFEFKSQSLMNAVGRLFSSGKACLRNPKASAVRNVLSYLQMQVGCGSAFPPIHARFFADKYLPLDSNSIVVDPCAGWGGRFVGTMLVPRSTKVTFFGIDPEERNGTAYQNLKRVIDEKLQSEVWGPREANFIHTPYEDWIETPLAKSLSGKVDLVMTSPPYASAEIYNTENPMQSANRYPTYREWRDGFLKPLIEGSYRLLKPGGHFVLNISNVGEAPSLENDALNIAQAIGFETESTYQLALSLSPGNRNPRRKVRTVKVDGVVFKREPVFCFEKPDRP